MPSSAATQSRGGRVLALLAALALATVLLPDAGQAQEVPDPDPSRSFIVAGPAGATPAGAATGYLTRAAVVPEGGSVTFLNPDVTGHNVVSVDTDDSGQPLFESAVVGLGGSAEVEGVAGLEQGVYSFYCGPHPWMQGELVVAPNPLGDAPELPLPDDGDDPAPDAPPAAGATYEPPYEEGPRGGGQGSMIETDPEEGRMLVGRAYPVPGAINCPGGGPYATFEVTHDLGPVTEVVAELGEAVVDAYSFVTLAAIADDGTWLASESLRGPLSGEATITAEVFDELPEDAESVTIRFGLEVASACPHVNGGTVLFEQVTVR